MSNALDLYPEQRFECPFFSQHGMQYCPFFEKKHESSSGSDHHHCAINHWLRKTMPKDYPDLTCDCFGVDSTQCPLQQYSEVRVRAGVDPCPSQ